MSTNDTLIETCSCFHALERVHYFPRQLITANDMTAEQIYFREKLRRHNRFMHGWGVVCGCEVNVAADAEHPWQVRISPGYLVTPKGDEVLIEKSVLFDLARDWRQPSDPCATSWPCPPREMGMPETEERRVYLAACFTECDTRPVRLHPSGCSCDESGCEYSRIRDSFEFLRLLELPASHGRAINADGKWKKDVEAWRANTAGRRPIPECPSCSDDCCDDSCVVLACITLPTARSTQISVGSITDEGRRPQYSVNRMTTFPGI